VVERIPRESREYLPVAVEHEEDITGYPVEMQVCPYGERPTEDGWRPAVWGTTRDGQTVAKVPIGPGTEFDFSTAPGTYIPWVRIRTPSGQELPVIEGQPFDIT